MDKLLIGTSGYDYPEWRGIFYPENLKRRDFLQYYASQFNALELNNTFYNMPTADRMLGFYEKSGGSLQFSVKANRLLTHEAGPDNPNGSSRYTYEYSDSELKDFVPIIQNVILTGKRPVVFFNNHPNGSGAKNAKTLYSQFL